MSQNMFLLDRFRNAISAHDAEEVIRCLSDLKNAYQYTMMKYTLQEMMVASRIPSESKTENIETTLTVKSDEIFQSFMAFVAHYRYNGLFSEIKKIYDESKSKEYSGIIDLFMSVTSHLFDDLGELCEENFGENSLFHLCVEHGSNIPYDAIKSIGEMIRDLSESSDFTVMIHNSSSDADLKEDTGNFNLIADGIRYADNIIEQFYTGKFTENDIAELTKTCEAMDHIMRNNVVVVDDEQERQEKKGIMNDTN